jgi:hypothetical protein
MRRIAAVITATLILSAPVIAADDLDNIGGLSQTQFRLLSEDLGAALSYKALTPAEPTGVTGFDIGIEATVTRLQNTNAFSTATSGSSLEVLPLVKVHVHKGLPLDFDIGAYYSTVPDSNIAAWGGELRYAVIKGGTATPAVAVRASYSALTGVNQMSLNTTGIDLSISKGFAFLTPYAGIGNVWVSSTPDNSIITLQKENFTLFKYFVGLNMNFAVLNIAIEADKTGDAASYGLKLGWRF